MTHAGNLSAFTRNEIQRLFASAQRVVHQHGITILKAPQTGTHGRILIVTPAKIGAAPVRNRIRRRLKSIFYQEHLYNTPYDYVVIVKKHGIKTPFDELKRLLAQAANTEKDCS